MRKGISPLIAAVILIAFVIAVAGVASGFFTGFIKGRQSEISEKGETTVSCGVANLEIQEDILSCSAPNWDSMEARWHFDEGSGLTAYDSSQNSNDGTLIDANSTNYDGDDPPHWVNGKFGKALDFDGVDDYVQLPTKWADEDELTWTAWIRPDSSGGKIFSGQNWRMWLKVDGDRCIVLTESNGDYRLGTYDAPLGEWTFFAYVFGSGRQEIWKNDIIFNSGSLEDYLKLEWGGIEDFQIGAGFDGKIDSVRIYSRALSQSEIEYLYSHGTHLRFPIWNKGRTSLGKKFGVTAIINGTSVSGSVSLDSSLDKTQIRTATGLENISVPGKLEKVRVASKACGSVYDSVEPSGVYC